jgi:hypothetical protein
MRDIDFDLLNANKESNPEVYKEVYESTIEALIRQDGISLNEELAILRKTVKYILEIIRELHEGELDIVKFTKHSNAIERIVKEVDDLFEEAPR